MRRGGDEAVRTRVQALIRNGQARFCDWVRLELWAGIGEAKRQWLRRMEGLLETVPTDDSVWEAARRLAGAARARGRTFPAADLLVSACARIHGLDLYHRDDRLTRLAEIPLPR